MTIRSGDRPPPRWEEIERTLSDLGDLLELWDGPIAHQLPTVAEKRDFLAIMSNFLDRLDTLQTKYYNLVDSVNFKLEMIKAHPTVYQLDPDFQSTVQIMKSLPDVRKKWYRHKK